MAEIRDYLIGHADGLAVSTALMGVAAMALVGFFALVHGRLRAASRNAEMAPAALLLAASVAITATLIGLVIQAALVHQIAQTADDSTLAAVYALWDRVFHTAPPMGMAVALLTASVTGPGRRALPRWTCLVALATSAVDHGHRCVSQADRRARVAWPGQPRRAVQQPVQQRLHLAAPRSDPDRRTTSMDGPCRPDCREFDEEVLV